MKLRHNLFLDFQKEMFQVLIFLTILFAVNALTVPERASASSYEYQKYMEKSSIPAGAVQLIINDLGVTRPLYIKQFAAYSQEAGGELANVENYIKYTAANQNEQNGIRFEITKYLKEGSSGCTFGCSIQAKVENWTDADNRDNKSLLSFEIYDQNGKLKSTALLSSVKPNKDNSNLTDKEAKIGSDWSYQLLKGESVLNYQPTDHIYLCVTQKSPIQYYDMVYVWYYDNLSNEMKPAYLSKPSMNITGDALDFSVENLSGTDKTYYFLIRSYQNQTVSKQRLYTLAVPSGTENTQFQLAAQTGDTISIYDETGQHYATDYELSTNQWVGTWASAQLTPGSDTMPPSPGLSGNTYRQSVRVSTGGSVLRITFSNEFGRTPLEIDSAYIAHLLEYGSSQIDASTNTLVTFNGGSSRVTIPAGGNVTSDDIFFRFEALDFIAVSTLFGKVPDTITSHTASRSTNCLAAGDHVTDEVFADYQTATSWYFLSEIDVLSPKENYAVVCLGDSITDGYGVQTNVIQRWSDVLANRLQENPKTQNVSVLNEGMGGNSIYGGLGPAAIRRFVRDVCEPAGVKYCLILIGVNDIGYASNDNSQFLIDGLKQMIETAHEHGIIVYGCTITPFGNNSYYSELHEKIRQEINTWIKSKDSGFDGVIDFAAAIADPANPSVMQAKYANDYLHPNAEGYALLGETIDLSIFTSEESEE